MKFIVTIEKEKENSNTIVKDYVDRNFIINHINAMIEAHENQYLHLDSFYRGIIIGLKEVRDEIKNLYDLPVF